MVLAHNINEGQRTRDIEISVDVTFDSMLLTEITLEGLKRSGFYKPSPIQLHGIPLGKCGFDLFLEAKSGTGKTAVFTVIALEKIALDKGLQAVILAPTREIASQICDVIKQVGSSYEGLNVEVVMGGLPIGDDIVKLKKKIHILVGSPGRMRHLIQDKHVDLTGVRLLVLDEADKLMDKSFQADINYIFSVLPKQKQVIMSSATYDKALNSIMQNYVQRAQHICPDSSSILIGIKQLVTTVTSNVNIVRQTQNKYQELVKILSDREFKQCLIFCNYQVRVKELCKMLVREKWPAEQLHGQLEQTDRLDALKTLQDYKCRILISTDLAARGIDASNVDIVVNFEPPYEWQTYLHRIGRAGRFGSYGIAITILSEGKEEMKFKEMIQSIGSSLTINYLWDGKMFELDESFSNCASLDKDEHEKDKVLTSKTEQYTSTVVESSDDIEVVSKENVNYIGQIIDYNKPHLESKYEININDLVKNTEKTKIISKLFEAFQKPCHCELESFNDLVSSFNAHEPSDSEETEIEDVSYKKYFDTIINEFKIQPSVVLERNSEVGTDSSKGNKHGSAETLSHSQQNKNNQNHKKVTTDSGVTSSGQNAGYNSMWTLNNINKKYLNNHANLSSPILKTSKNSLTGAGLPTAFGSTKHSYINKGNNCNVHNKGKSSHSKESRSNNQPKLNQDEFGLLIETHSKNSREPSCLRIDDDVYNKQSARFNGSSKYTCHVQEIDNSHIRNDSSRNIADINAESSDVPINTKINKKYYKWYNQLKSHIQQVEMSLYIIEMSEM